MNTLFKISFEILTFNIAFVVNKYYDQDITIKFEIVIPTKKTGRW